MPRTTVQAAPMKPLDDIAQVVREPLSDSSTVYNVKVYAGDGVSRAFTIGAFSAEHAFAIAKAINDGAAWIEQD